MGTTNDKIMDWIVKKAETEYAKDISVLLVYGSYLNGTANAKSDVDCYYIPKTARGGQFARTFILNGIGYDIFPMDWGRVENIASLNEVLIPLVGDVKILFYNSEEDWKRFRGLQDQLRSNLRSKDHTEKAAGERVRFACALYSQMKHSERFSDIRTCAGHIIMTLADAVAVYNQDYFHFGLKRQYEDLKRFRNVPEHFQDRYLNVIKAEDGKEIAEHCFHMLESVKEFMGLEAFAGDTEENGPSVREKKQPDYAQLASFYEEMCSTFNKIYVCCENGNSILAFLSAVCLQNELNEQSQEYGIACYDILSSYRYHDLSLLASAACEVEHDFVRQITEGGGRIKSFDSFEAFEAAGL